MGGARAGSGADGPSAGADYEIRVRGSIGEAFRAEFGELTIVLHPAETVLLGAGLDQAALYGILDRVQAFGLELLEVRRLPGARDGGR
ncbi:hypothetical protein [Streptomyces sp. NPDC046939]|uniref:hypothetical protein n=1 Tax=Streptomyces sp. NPDC046939 TaxID=3155376 RepID=UPI0033D17C34